MNGMGTSIRAGLFVPILALIGYGLFLALQGSPPDAAQGNMIRAFYYHFPNWIGSGLFFPVNFAASVLYLIQKGSQSQLAIKVDAIALASAEMGVLYCTL